MSDTIPKLPGLTGKTEAQLQTIYTEVIGGEVPAGLDTVAKLTHGIKEAYAAKYPDLAKTDAAPVAGAAVEAAPTGHVRVTDSEGFDHDLPQAVWDNLGPRQKEYTLTGEKPASLPKA